MYACRSLNWMVSAPYTCVQREEGTFNGRGPIGVSLPQSVLTPQGPFALIASCSRGLLWAQILQVRRYKDRLRKASVKSKMLTTGGGGARREADVDGGVDTVVRGGALCPDAACPISTG